MEWFSGRASYVPQGVSLVKQLAEDGDVPFEGHHGRAVGQLSLERLENGLVQLLDLRLVPQSASIWKEGYSIR